jgi:hypothetical protein
VPRRERAEEDAREARFRGSGLPTKPGRVARLQVDSRLGRSRIGGLGDRTMMVASLTATDKERELSLPADSE